MEFSRNRYQEGRKSCHLFPPPLLCHLFSPQPYYSILRHLASRNRIAGRREVRERGGGGGGGGGCAFLLQIETSSGAQGSE
jgi:hypothetical protein